MDDRFDTDSSVGAGAGDQLHDGRVDSYPAGNCCYRDPDQHYSGTQSFVACRRLSTDSERQQKGGAK